MNKVITEDTITQSVELAVSMHYNNEPAAKNNDYDDINVSVKAVKIIQSYTDIVNRTVWRKS